MTPKHTAVQIVLVQAFPGMSLSTTNNGSKCVCSGTTLETKVGQTQGMGASMVLSNDFGTLLL
jgi:hypothetical protein